MITFLAFPVQEKNLLTKAAEHLEISDQCHFSDGIDANRDYLGLVKQNNHTVVFPDVIFLNGDAENFFELLRNLKLYEPVRPLPIVALGYKSDGDHILRFYDGGGNSYVKKPADFSKMMEISTNVISYWLKMAQLPSKYLH